MKLEDKATMMLLEKSLREITQEEWIDIECFKDCDDCECFGNGCVYALIAELLMQKGVKVDLEVEVQEDA